MASILQFKSKNRQEGLRVASIPKRRISRVSWALFAVTVICVVSAVRLTIQELTRHQRSQAAVATWNQQRKRDKFVIVSIRPGQSVRVRLWPGATRDEASNVVSDYAAAAEEDGTFSYLPAEISGVGEAPIVPPVDLTLVEICLVCGLAATLAAVLNIML